LKALVKYAHGEGNMELREIEPAKPVPDEVMIAVRGCGVCGSDLHVYYDHMKTPLDLPVVTGHEFSGEIVELGSNVEGYSVGDRVTVIPNVWTCGKCDYCKTGYINLCPNRKVIAYSRNGAFAKYCTVPASALFKLPENVDTLSGVLTEPLACCVHGVIEQTGISAGDFVAVTGPGAIGLLTLQLARAEGGITLICGISGDEKRLELAKKLGADYVINANEENPVEFVNDITGGYGVDVVLECAGAAPAARLALNMIRKRGKYTQMGLFGHPIEIDFELIAYKELQVTGFVSQKLTSWHRALRLMEYDKISTKELISHQMPLSEWKRAFEMFERREGVKLILCPEE